jgi:hypothetical protein
VARSRQRLALLESDFLFRSTLPVMTNWLGEFSAAVFKARAADYFLQPRMAGICHYGLYDFGIFLRSAATAGALFINEHLGAFRRSGSQFSSQTGSPVMRCSIVAWIALAIAAHNESKISGDELLSCSGLVLAALQRYFADDPLSARVLALRSLVEQRDVTALKDAFLPLWPLFLDHIDPSLL